MTPKETAIVLAKALDSKKGIDIKVLETGHLTTLADYFVICTATSTTQVRALSDERGLRVSLVDERRHLGPAGLLLRGGAHLHG